jgi:hypothetical protein
MAEVLINLNSIVSTLKRLQRYNPPGKSRIADWELFGRKIHLGFPENPTFRLILDKMNVEKDRFSIEDDPLFIILKKIVIENGLQLNNLSANDLYSRLNSEAEMMRMKDFQRKYRSPISISKRLANIKDELQRVFDFEAKKGRSNLMLYSFAPRHYEEDEELYAELQEDEEWEPCSQG